MASASQSSKRSNGNTSRRLEMVREASTALRRMPDPFHQPEPWKNLLENVNEWSKALRELDVKCSRPKKSERARCMSDDQLVANPQVFVCMLCSSDKRRCCNSAGALVSHQHRSHGYKNPFRRATVDDSCPAHRLQSIPECSILEWQHSLGFGGRDGAR